MTNQDYTKGPGGFRPQLPEAFVCFILVVHRKDQSLLNYILRAILGFSTLSGRPTGERTMDWTDEVIVKLRNFWAEGHSTAEIGRRLNISKNAVVGKAHRLSLPPRPSPIRRDGATGGTPRAAAPRRIQGPTLRTIMAAPKQTLRATPCCWPIGEPGKPSFHFCNGNSVPGKPYCDAHASIAYVRVRDRREDAA